MAKASTKVSRKNGRKKKGGQVKIPRPAVWLILAAAGGLILMALATYDAADPAAFGSSRSGGAVQNGLGLAGAYAASFLIQSFGLGAVWPVFALLAGAWLVFKKIRPGQSTFFKLAGWALFLFAALTILALTWPHHPWPQYGGGGRFGHFLAGGAVGLLGRLGASLALPVLALVGLFTAVPSLWRKGQDLYAEMKAERAAKIRAAESARLAAEAARARSRPEEDHDLGLDEDPLEAPEPIIVEKPRPEPAPRPKKTAPPRREEEAVAFKPQDAPYELPSVEFLDLPPKGQGGHSSGLPKDKLMENARLLESKLRDFGVDGRVLEVSGGPVITMYEYQPAPGIKISKVAGLADDLTMAMRAISIRVVAPLPGKAAIGIEIPNPRRSLVTFREVVESQEFQNAASPLTLVLGVDIMGAPVVADLAKMPHLLIAGATGSGKSVGLGSMIMSILYKADPERVRFLMIDPKCVELALYKDIPHLIYPVLSDPSEATLGLKWAVAEMDMRYKLLAEKGVRNIESYNAKIREELKTWKPPKKRPGDEDEEPGPEPPKELPFLVIIIDELADLMMVSAKEVEVYITRLAQKARAAGIHLILATQRPSVDVLTGIIKANMPTRISFQVSSRIDSRTILDQMGAEKLLGQGDMLFLPPGVGKLRRLHGAFVSDDEIKTVTDFVRQWGPPEYLEDLSLPEADGDGEFGGERDDKYEEAVELVRRTQRATISHVQRHLRIGYNRAARIIEDMEREGIIGPQDGTRPRAIF